MSQKDSVLRRGHNCWRTNEAIHATMLVDCANYYRALHHAICKAKHSVFILGWDIDSRIRLLRGKDAENSECPVTAGDLLAWKARQNPDIQIYLLRWDFSLVFMNERELLAKKTWDFKTPENVHIWLDRTIPVGGSHHQKVVVVDDEIAFTGGMDIALKRWDDRDHSPHNPEREDPNGTYGPYHDIQLVVDGPVVEDLAKLARVRWKLATGLDAIPMREDARRDNLDRPPETWPPKFAPWYRDVRCGIARTIPAMGEVGPVYEVHNLYLDLIKTAEKFIYIENQFLAREDIARLLNRQLKAKPKLRVLLLSSYNPQGVFEKEAMWSGRIKFKKLLMDGVDPSRVRMVYPVVYDSEGEPYYTRIHSKILIIDDRYHIVGSSNINNRSMGLDTECDFVIEATSTEDATAIADARNDLFAEHAGKSIEKIGEQIRSGATIDTIIEPDPGYNRRVKTIDDTIFTKRYFEKVTRPLADPKSPLLPPLSPDSGRPPRNPSRTTIALGAMGLLLLLGIGYFIFSNFSHLLTPEIVAGFLETARGTPWALPLVCVVYIGANLIFFPITVLTLATAMVFGALLGPIYAICGALVSAAVMFGLGHVIGRGGLRKLMGERLRTLDAKLTENSVAGVAMVRMVPIAPFTLVNLVGGISSISFIAFMAGTFLGFLPGAIAKGLVGDSLARIVLNPTPSTLIYLGAGILLWIVLVVGSQKLVKAWQRRRQQDYQPAE